MLAQLCIVNMATMLTKLQSSHDYNVNSTTILTQLQY